MNSAKLAGYFIVASSTNLRLYAVQDQMMRLLRINGEINTSSDAQGTEKVIQVLFEYTKLSDWTTFQIDVAYTSDLTQEQRALLFNQFSRCGRFQMFAVNSFPPTATIPFIDTNVLLNMSWEIRN